MSETTNTGTTERKLVTVNGRSGSAEAQDGELNFVRPSKLTDADIGRTVAAGVYEGNLPNKFDDTKLDYKIRASNGDLTIVNSCGSIASQMAKIEVGTYVELLYKGKAPIKTGKMQGKPAHSFVVLMEDTQETA